MRLRITGLLAAVFVASHLGVGAASADTQRTIRFDHLSTEQGLPQEAVHAIYQDSLGFMWFGTQEGLVRYDGQEFRVYDHDPEDPTSIASGWVWSIYEDRSGNLWIGTDGGGLHRFDPTSETFERFSFEPSDPGSLSGNQVRVIVEDGHGNLWVGTESGLNRLGPERETFERFTHDPANAESISSNRVRSILTDVGGAVWVGTDGGGISRLAVQSGSFSHLRHDPERPGSLGGDRIRDIYRAADGTIWVGTYDTGLDQFDAEQDDFVHHRYDADVEQSLGDNRIRDIFQDSHGTLWVATDGGLSEWLPELGTFENHRHDSTAPTSLSDDRVNVVMEDEGGVLWVGTYSGLNKFSLASGFFSHYLHDSRHPNGLSHNVVTSFAEGSDGHVWIGTYGGGLNRLDPATGHFTEYRHDEADPASLVDDNVMAVHVDSAGFVWVGTFAHGLDRLDPTTGIFEHFVHDPNDPDSLSANAVTLVFEDRNGIVWVGTYRGGLNRFDRRRQAFVHYRHDPTVPSSLSNDAVLAIHQDRLGVLWVGTDGGGLNRFEPGNATFTHYQHDTENPRSLSSDSAWSIHEDASGGFWVGTQGGGLNYWPADARMAHRNQFRRYLKSDGLPSAVVYGVTEDLQGRLWLSTNRGISRLNPSTGDVKNFMPRHGLQDMDFNFGALLRTSDGQMYFGGSNGFNAFDPALIVDNQHAPPVVLTAVHKFSNRAWQTVPMAGPSPIELDHTESVVTFDFAALDYTAPENNRYRHKLDGFDELWNESTTNSATYTNLDPGDYTFRVRAANNDGVWNEVGIAQALTVFPPWWQTSWAYAGYGLAIIALGIGIERRHRSNLEIEARHARNLEKQVEARTRELAERNAELAELNQKLEAASYTDALTGLFNRRFLANQIEKDVALVRRAYSQDGSPAPGDPPRDLMFLMLDVDGLKGINDTFGHAAGDRTLMQVKEILTRVCRKSDMLVRWGGDEFLLIGRHTDRLMAEEMAERIRRAIVEHEFDLGAGNKARLSTSIGFSMYPFLPSSPNLFNWEQVVHMADRGLYQAKNSGRNRWTGVLAAQQADPQTLLKRMDEDLGQLAEQGILKLRSRKIQRTIEGPTEAAARKLVALEAS